MKTISATRRELVRLVGMTRAGLVAAVAAVIVARQARAQERWSVDALIRR